MLRHLIFAFFLFMLAACASVVPPTGGPVDETPPVCEEITPENKTINFKAKEIEFSFDEYVVLNDINNQFIISPPLDKKPNIKIKGKKIIVAFEEELKANTTYTINFGNGIKDNNEANILSGLDYTFSTGSYIDSLSLTGKAKDAFTLLPVENIAIGLYKSDSDSSIFKNKPWYLARPDSSGRFNFKNLSPGEYELVAFEDANRNLKIETNEKMAFRKEKIELNYFEKDSSIYSLLLSPQYIELLPKIVTYRELAKGKYQIITSGSKCNFSVNQNQFNKKATQIVKTPYNNCDTITVFTNNECIDSTLFRIEVDTLVENIVINCKSDKYKTLSIFSSTNAINYNYLLPFRISFSNPPVEIREKEFILIEDSTRVENFTILPDSLDPLSLLLQYPFKKEKEYTLSIPTGSIKDLYNQTLDSSGITISTAAESFFGNLSIIVPNQDSTQLIVQLLDAQSKVIHQNIINKPATLEYQNSTPGQYFVKVIEDRNKNGKWDGGNYFTKQQPERVYITPQSLEVRANWDLTDIKIETGF